MLNLIVKIGVTVRTIILLILSSLLNTVSAVELEKAIMMLEAMGDYDTAEPIAFKLTQQKKRHHDRIEFLKKYGHSEFVGIVYQQSWKAISVAENTAMLRSFIKVRPNGVYSQVALDQLLVLYQQENTILGYQELIKAFPNTAQAAKALNAIYKLAYERAQKHANDDQNVKIYDAYIQTFPASPYLKEVVKKAETLEYQSISDTLNGFSISNLFSDKQQQKETLARKLYNEHRRLQQKGQWLIAQRKYNLLQKTDFVDTKAYTEMMDRQETQDFRQALFSYQQQTNQQLENLKHIYQEESQRIIQTIEQQAQLTRQAIVEQGRRNRHDMATLTSAIDDLSYEKGRLADAVNQQTDQIAEATRQASYEQRQLFERSQETARRQVRQNRHCAEVLTTKGEYTIFSGCP